MDLTKADITRLLDELILKMKAKNVVGTISIYGGSAILFYNENRGVTRDVDSIISPHNDIVALSAELSTEHIGLPTNWLNSAISTVMPPKPDESPEIYYKDANITVQYGSKEYLLAMKATNPRRSDRDLHDAALLYNSLSLKSYLDIEKVIRKYYGGGKNWGSQELFWEEIEDLAYGLMN